MSVDVLVTLKIVISLTSLDALGRSGGGFNAYPESTRKRAQSEFGDRMANDFSESAVHATSQQPEDFSKLAILTTFLLYSATLMQLTLTHAPTVLTHLASQAVALAPAAQQATTTSSQTVRPTLKSPWPAISFTATSPA